MNERKRWITSLKQNNISSLSFSTVHNINCLKLWSEGYSPESWILWPSDESSLEIRPRICFHLPWCKVFDCTCEREKNRFGLICIFWYAILTQTSFSAKSTQFSILYLWAVAVTLSLLTHYRVTQTPTSSPTSCQMWVE